MVLLGYDNNHIHRCFDRTTNHVVDSRDVKFIIPRDEIEFIPKDDEVSGEQRTIISRSTNWTKEVNKMAIQNKNWSAWSNCPIKGQTRSTGDHAEVWRRLRSSIRASCEADYVQNLTKYCIKTSFACVSSRCSNSFPKRSSIRRHLVYEATYWFRGKWERRLCLYAQEKPLRSQTISSYVEYCH